MHNANFELTMTNLTLESAIENASHRQYQHQSPVEQVHTDGMRGAGGASLQKEVDWEWENKGDSTAALSVSRDRCSSIIPHILPHSP